MADELELDLDSLDDQINRKNKIQERFVDLSNKVKTTAEERDEAQRRADKLAEERASFEKERDFYKDFSKVTGKFQAASEYQDDILAKVKSGYSVEDATVAVLNANNKLIPEAQPPQPREQIAGGSAPSSMPPSGDKSVAEMSREEKRNALIQAGADQPWR